MRYSKGIIVSLLVMSVHFPMAQEVEVEEDVTLREAFNAVELEFDAILEGFSKTGINSYTLEGGLGMIGLEVRQYPYEDFKERIGTFDGGLIKMIEEKEITLDGTKFIYAKQEQDRGGILVEMISYIKHNNSKSVIIIGATYIKEYGEKFKSLTESIAKSARIKKE